MKTDEGYAEFVRVGNFTTDERDSKFLAGMGLAGEAGEVCDELKKVLIHGKTLDRVKLIDELGDVLWYFQHTLNEFGISVEEVVRHNVFKLCERYPDQYGKPDRWINPSSPVCNPAAEVHLPSGQRPDFDVVSDQR